MTETEAPTTAIAPLSTIRLGNNPRRYFDQREHDELVASLRLQGWLQPMLVQPNEDGGYSIVAGGRRYRAAIDAFGPDAEVPVFVRQFGEQDALPAAITENDSRADPSETEQADAASRVLSACQNDRAEAARRLGWSTTKLDRRLALAHLSEPVKIALDERRIKVGHAELLATVPLDKQEKALDAILKGGLDVAKTRASLTVMAQSLAGACFDKGDCTTCEFNSATQRALFETHIDDGHCTNPPCYQLKTEAAEQASATEQKAEAELAKENAPTAADEPPPANADITTPAESDAAPPAPPTPKTTPAAVPAKATVTAQSLAERCSMHRETSWRIAAARLVETDNEAAHTVIIAAALSGTLGEIKAASLTARAWLLVNEQFPRASFRERIEAVDDLPALRRKEAIAAIGVAYVKNAADFGHVADIAAAFDVDLRDSWHVDKDFLAPLGKDELKFVAIECGLVDHMGERAFAKLLKAKPEDIAAGMLSATGFDWAGRLPSAMTLDGAYGPPIAAVQPAANGPSEAAEPAENGEASTDRGETATEIAETSTDPLDSMRTEIRELADEPAVIVAKDKYADEPEAFIRDADGGWSADEGDTGYPNLSDLLENCEIITGHWPTREAYEDFANPTPRAPVPAEKEETTC
jgi:ParB family chromosome partitioning protein